MRMNRGILTNSFWYGLEMSADIIFGALTSIAIARVIGPEALGHFVYLVFLTNVAGKLGGLGVATAVKKYLAEHLGRGETGLARAVFYASLRMQAVLAVAIPLGGIALVLLLGAPERHLMSCLLVLAIAPGLLSAIPALANVAAQNFARNVPGALSGLVAYAVTVAFSLTLGWGLVGLAAAVLLRRTVELSVRLWPAIRWINRLPQVKPPEGLNRKLLAFSGQSLAVTLLMVVVWDRSELLFLKQFSSAAELAFYTVAFGLTEQILMLPNVFSGAIGAALMGEYAADRARAGKRASDAVRHLALLVFPIHAGLALMSSPAIRLAYGSAYIPAIPVLSIAVLLGIPKAFFWLPTSIYQAADRQVTMFRWLLVAAAVNIGLDALLIPRFGSVGAALANGLSQSFAVFATWRVAALLCGLVMPWNSVRRVALSALLMAAAVLPLILLLPPLPALLCGIPAGVVLYGLLLRLLRVVNEEDLRAMESIVLRLPRPAQLPLRRVVRLLVASPGPGAPHLEEEIRA